MNELRPAPVHCHICEQEYVGDGYSDTCLMCGAVGYLSAPGSNPDRTPEEIERRRKQWQESD